MSANEMDIISETKKLLQEIQNTQANIITKEDQLRKLEDNLRAEQSKLDKYSSKFLRFFF